MFLNRLCVITLAIAAAATAQIANASNGTPLWRTIEAGMTPQEVLSNVVQFEEVKAAKIKTKDGKEKDLEIEYVNGGINLGEHKVQLHTSFENGLLEEISLASIVCESNGIVFLDSLDANLSEKFGRRSTIKFSDHGVITDHGLTYSNGITRVFLTAVTFRYSGPVTFSQRRAIRSDNRECSRDSGAKLEITISYQSETAFQASQNQEKDAREVSEKDLKAGL